MVSELSTNTNLYEFTNEGLLQIAGTSRHATHRLYISSVMFNIGIPFPTNAIKIFNATLPFNIITDPLSLSVTSSERKWLRSENH